jgi:hypothetical protein
MVDKAAADLNEQHNAVNFSGGAGAAAAFGLKVLAGRPCMLSDRAPVPDRSSHTTVAATEAQLGI